MAWYSDFKFTLYDYKCFGDAGASFGNFQLVNVLIGKNNTGKSTIIDFVEALCAKKYRAEIAAQGSKAPSFTFEGKLTESALRAAFREGTSGGPIHGNHWEYGKLWIGKSITLRVEGTKANPWASASLVGHDPLRHRDHPELSSLVGVHDYLRVLLGRLENPFAEKAVIKIAAERQVKPEADGRIGAVSQDGTGITLLLENYCNYSVLDNTLVENVMLEGLNAIFSGEATFSRISVQRRENDNLWEIYLHEDGKGRIPLSESGSGLQTVIFVLACLHIIPVHLKKSGEHIVYAFEELENNLHPSVIRRLMDYIYSQCEKDGVLCFITTHSPVCIDFFGNRPQTQIIHVQGKQGKTQTSTISTHSEYGKVLADIDAKASDLLQANGVVWVEGPSDRVLINRWLSIVSKGVLKEGLHYVCAFYGGKLLKRISAAVPERLTEEVPLVFLNRNIALIMDSDRKSSTIFRYSKTKHRIEDEIRGQSGFCWVTLGKEIENYISPRIVAAIRGPHKSAKASALGIADEFYTSILPVAEEYSRIIERKEKITLAQQVADMTQPADLDVLDLREKVSGLCEAIRKWNNL